MEKLATTDIKYLRGIGEALGKLLREEMEISTLRDLAYYFPTRYVDRSRYYRIAEFDGEMPYVQVRGRFVSFVKEGEGARKRLVGLFTDGERQMEVVWFSKINAIADAYRPDKEYVIFARPSRFKDRWSMVHPEVDEYKPEAPAEPFLTIYSIPEKARKRGVTMRGIRRWMRNLMENPAMRRPAETLPTEIVEALRLMPLREAIRAIHFPTSATEMAEARRRFKIEELFYIQLHILRFSRHRNSSVRGQVLPKIGDCFNSFYRNVLPFPLTGAQKRVVREIHADMASGRQMNRLLQGDVGSGKTLVAFLSMLIAADNGAQACLMAPTEILATQHYESLRQWCLPLGINISLLKGSTGRRERRFIDEALRDGSIQILVGTHALIEDHVVFHNLGLAVIDEQHRFGVAQRARLWEKNTMAPHMLVMTATPIPRTLAMTLYGDLSVSVIDELPPGRKPIRTSLCLEDDKERMWRLVGKELQAGRQAYIVYPLISESEKMDLKSLEEGLRTVQGIFGEYFRIAYVHGRMKPEEKEYQMQLFVSGKARILVATTVIEVGVNVPNASVMVIENAERFGLSQLHQLRGRVGRGADLAYCVLVSKRQTSAVTRQRLELMTRTTDGFEIAEADMKARGPGDLEGTMQSGLPFKMKVASLASDGNLLEIARNCAMSALNRYPSLSSGASEQETTPSLDIMTRELDIRFGRSYDWSRIS